MKYAHSAIELIAKRRANPLNRLRDGSEKAEGFPRGARETMVARYKGPQLGMSGWNPERKALGFFGHVTWQVSGWREGEAGERVARDVSTPSHSKKGKLRPAAQTVKSG